MQQDKGCGGGKLGEAVAVAGDAAVPILYLYRSCRVRFSARCLQSWQQAEAEAEAGGGRQGEGSEW
jgi:hypothetical protein